jgi:SDR family mycofactocin-dependent oxidoreductase
MGRVEGKVAFITGAARGMGRSHAVRLAQEGADIIAVDIDEQVEMSWCPTATAEDLGRRIVARTADVRDLAALESVVAEGVGEFGRLDIVCANAGIGALPGAAWELTEQQWQGIMDVNLTGVWKTAKAAIPAMIAQGNGGSITLISSLAGKVALPHMGHYVTAKHGVIGLMRTLALELAPHGIRCNAVLPSNVDTPILANPVAYELLTGIPGADREVVAKSVLPMNALKIPWMEPVDISNAVLWLSSDEARYVTGTTQLIDAGAHMPFKIPHG